MAKNDDIVSYSADEVKEMRRRGESRTDWARVDATDDAEIAAQAARDPDWQDLAPDWVARATVGLPFPTSEPKRQVTIRLDPDVLDHFRRGGRGWQSRINAVLRSFVQADRQHEQE